MKKFQARKQVKRLFSSRLFITVLLIVLQLLLLFVLSDLLPAILLRGLSIAAVFWILSRQDDPSYKISWIVLIFLFPLAACLFYLIFGNKRFGLNMRKQLAAFSKAKPDCSQERNSLPHLTEQNPAAARLAVYLQTTAAAPVHEHSTAAYFPSGEAFFQRLVAELKEAQHFILLEYFIIGEGQLWSSVLEILEQKVAQGVEIRILYDDAGCLATLPEQFQEIMEDKGIHAAVFNPLQPRLNTFLNYRDHRKICVIDGHIAFTGGVNISDEYVNLKKRHGHWKDTGIMVKGPAAENLTRLFLQLWCFSTRETLEAEHYASSWKEEQALGFVQPFGSDPMEKAHSAKGAYLQLIQQASSSLWIATPYLILDDETRGSLQAAARSGVDVRIVTPHVPDKWYVHAVTRSFYQPLLESGVRIFEYTPGFIHAKMLLADEDKAIVGTTNLDYRSFYLQFECGVALYGCPAIGEIRQDFRNTVSLSQEITMEQIRSTPWPIRLLRTLLRNFAPLL